CASPTLQASFARASFRDRSVLLEIDEPDDSVLFGKSRNDLCPMLHHAAEQVIRHADVEHAISSVCQDVDVVSTHRRTTSAALTLGDPGSAAHHYVLRRARDTVHFRTQITRTTDAFAASTPAAPPAAGGTFCASRKLRIVSTGVSVAPAAAALPVPAISGNFS